MLSPIRPATLVLLALALAMAAGGAFADAGADAADRNGDSRELVVLVHGMGRSSVSMAPLGWTLKRAGYDVMNWGYSSTCCEIAELGARLERDLLEREEGSPARVHFVGHSLGNIIVRWVLAHDLAGEMEVGRIVMLAPPNRGSRVADRLAPTLGWLLKPLPELGTAPMLGSRELHLPQAIEVGIIAGRYDGKVAIDETALEGMDEHLVLPATHPFLMFRPDVHRLVVRYLETGSFADTSLITEPHTTSEPVTP
jgi:pimeloyl-ACP methyl ester carboxylesterase